MAMINDWIWYGKDDTCHNWQIVLGQRLSDGLFDTIHYVEYEPLKKKIVMNNNNSNYVNTPGYEVFFEYPFRIGIDIPDTFYFLERSVNFISFSSGCSQHLLGYHILGEDLISSLIINGYFHEPCGCGMKLIPIVKLRCDKPKGFRLLSREGSSATVAWQGSFDVETYQLSIGNMTDGPESGQFVTIASDSTEFGSTLTYTYDSLSAGVRHAVWLRKSCRYTTTGYDTLVWSPWSNMVAFFTLGSDEAGDLSQAFTISPNPATEIITINVEPYALGGRLQLMDLQGRILEERTATESRIVMDINAYPAGTYLLKMLTAGGIGVRRVMVR